MPAYSGAFSMCIRQLDLQQPFIVVLFCGLLFHFSFKQQRFVLCTSYNMVAFNPRRLGIFFFFFCGKNYKKFAK